jgi:hypothetical protein
VKVSLGRESLGAYVEKKVFSLRLAGSPKASASARSCCPRLP